jgi:hypothetical protein
MIVGLEDNHIGVTFKSQAQVGALFGDGRALFGDGDARVIQG